MGYFLKGNKMRMNRTDQSILSILGIIRISCFLLIASTLQKDLIKKKDLIIIPKAEVKPPKTNVSIINKHTYIKKKDQFTSFIQSDKYPALKCEKLVNIRAQLLTRLQMEEIPKIKVKRKIKIAVVDTGLNIHISAFHNRFILTKKIN